jgi:hypothetical protein
MTDPKPSSPVVDGVAGDEPRRSRLRQILDERPEERPKIARAVGGLLAVTLVTIAVVGLLLIWHLRRRAGIIRNRLAPPREIQLPDLPRKRHAETESDFPETRP